MIQTSGQELLTRDDRSAEATSFIGRRQEMADVRRLLPRTRLLTLTGPGGVGKTRLAMRAAQALRGWFPAGVTFVELAALEDGALLEATVAAALGLRDTGRLGVPVLVDHLADKRMLLVLDNCEHLLQECADLADRLLRGAPRLRILATSRHTLGVAGELVLPVPALPVPRDGGSLRGIVKNEAVRLLAERAAEVRPGFAVDEDNASAVVRLSQRLDGIPLAIELAAVRLRTTPLEELLRELDDRFEVLTGGSSAALPRHRTMLATMDWSFGLCSPDERRLWARMSMFPGGADLETVEEVCSGNGLARDQMADLVAGLVDKSVLSVERKGGPGGQAAGRNPRYRMLESLRAYGRASLSQAEERALRERLRDHYGRLAGRIRVDHMGPDQIDRYLTTRVELPNFRLALDMCFSSSACSGTGLEIASAFWAYWILSGAMTEGRYWLRRGLELLPEAGTIRATALWTKALLAIYQGDFKAAKSLIAECRTVAQRTGDASAIAFAVQISGIAALSAGEERGFALMEDAREQHRALGDIDAVSVNLYNAAAWGAVQSPGRAEALGTELLALSESHKARLFQAYALLALGYAAWQQGSPAKTAARMRGAATIMRVIDDRWGLTQCLEALAWTAGVHRRHERAALLLGAAHRLWQAMDTSPSGQTLHAWAHEDCTAQARQALGDVPFAAAFRRGARLLPDRAVACALEDLEI